LGSSPREEVSDGSADRAEGDATLDISDISHGYVRRSILFYRKKRIGCV
jgi:hypothetical protein